MNKAYKAYFDMPVGDQGKPWALRFTCNYWKENKQHWKMIAEQF